jgi:hypothetical protein
LTLFYDVRFHHFLPPSQQTLKNYPTLMSLAVNDISWGKVRVVSLHSDFTSLRNSRTGRTHLICQFADHSLNLRVEVVNIGCLHLLEMLQLFSISKLHLTRLSADRLQRILILKECWWHGRLTFTSPLFVEFPILSSFLTVRLGLSGEVWPFECFVITVEMVWTRKVAHLAVHFNTKNITHNVNSQNN